MCSADVHMYLDFPTGVRFVPHTRIFPCTTGETHISRMALGTHVSITPYENKAFIVQGRITSYGGF